MAMRITLTRALLLSVAGAFFFAGQAFAHRDWQLVVGSFTRADGVVVSVVMDGQDGIIGNERVTIQFRLPDGTVVASTERSTDEAIVRSTRQAVDVHLIQSSWFPIASKVKRFDGYTLKDITSPSQNLLSVVLHIREHRIAYVLVLLVAALLFAVGRAVAKTPIGGASSVIQLLAFAGIAFIGSIILLVAPVSPLILLAIGGLGFGLRWLLRKGLGHLKRVGGKQLQAPDAS